MKKIVSVFALCALISSAGAVSYVDLFCYPDPDKVAPAQVFDPLNPENVTTVDNCQVGMNEMLQAGYRLSPGYSSNYNSVVATSNAVVYTFVSTNS